MRAQNIYKNTYIYSICTNVNMYVCMFLDEKTRPRRYKPKTPHKKGLLTEPPDGHVKGLTADSLRRRRPRGEHRASECEAIDIP
jgi:hypothetical protein